MVFSGTGSPSLASVVLDSALSGHTVAGSVGAAISDLDLDVGNLTGTQPRINYPATWRLKLSNRNAGTYKATRPVRLRPGSVDTTVSVDCTPIFGNGVRVSTVGTPTVSGGSITAAALGPRDEAAVVSLAGTATASETQTVTFDVTAENGDTEEVVVDLRVFGE